MGRIGRLFRPDGGRNAAGIPAAFVCVAAVFIIGVTFIVSRQINTSFIRNFELHSLAQLSRMGGVVSAFLGSARDMAEYLAADRLMQEAPGKLTVYSGRTEDFWTRAAELPEYEQRIIAEFARVQKIFPAYESMYMGDRTGGFVRYPDDTLPAGYNPSTRPWYIQAADGRGAVVTGASLSTGNEAVCAVVTPIRDSQNRVQGALALDVNLKTLTRSINAMPVGQTGCVLLIDRQGTVLTDPPPALFGNDPDTAGLDRTDLTRNALDRNGLDRNDLTGAGGASLFFKNVDDLAADPAKPQPALRDLRARKNGVAEVILDGRERLAAVSTTAEGWTLILLIDRAEVLADATGIARGIFRLGLGILVIVPGIAWLVARFNARPAGSPASSSLPDKTPSIRTLLDASRALASLARRARQMARAVRKK